MKRIGLAWLYLVACGPNVGTDDDGADAGGTAESSGAATTSTTSSMTTETVTSAGTTATTVTTTSATQSSGESGDTTTAGSTTGSGPECTDASDCELFSTCCDCEALPVGDIGVDNCPGIDCETDACTMWGISEVQCRAGSCTVVRTSCNPNGVVCALAPPDCEPGLVPGTADGCWTGQCIPAELCDYVPACDACPDDHLCVSWLPGPKGPTLHSCEPFPPECGGVATCECASDLCIGWGECFPGGDTAISCAGA